MQESNLNLIIKNSIIKSEGWAFKIPDPSGIAVRMVIKNPFDGFGFLPDFCITWESKFMKGGYQSFNIKGQVKEHQLENLEAIKKIYGQTSKDQFVLPLIILGVYFPRQHIELFCFDIDFINSILKDGKKSILKKELLKLSEDGKTIIVKKQEFDAKMIKEKIIKAW